MQHPSRAPINLLVFFFGSGSSSYVVSHVASSSSVSPINYVGPAIGGSLRRKASTPIYNLRVLPTRAQLTNTKATKDACDAYLGSYTCTVL